MEVVIMPKMHSDTKLKELLESNGVPLNNAVKRGEFYRSYFDWNFLAEKYKEGNSIRDISKLTGLSYDAVRVNLIRVLGELRPFNIYFRGFSYFDFSLYVYTNTSEVIPLRRKFERFMTQCERSILGRTSPYKHVAKDVRDSLNQYAYWRSAKAD